MPAAKGIRKDWQEGNSLVPTVLLCPLHLVAKHMVQGKPRGGGSPTQNCLLQSHSRPCHWTSEGPIFMPVGGHCQLGGTFPLFLGPRPAATDLSKRVSLKALWRLIFSPPESQQSALPLSTLKLFYYSSRDSFSLTVCTIKNRDKRCTYCMYN